MQTKSELPEVLSEIHQKLSVWELEVERSKKPSSRYIATIGWKGMAAMLQYYAAVRIARLGADLLERSLVNRRDGLLFGLTKRPMFESYTRGMWLEFVADEEFAKENLSRSSGDVEREWMTLASKRKSPSLDKMWNNLHKKDVLRETVSWMRSKKDWWNDSIHISARSAWMGWSNEYGEVIYSDEQIKSDLTALLEIGAQCAGHILTLDEGLGESEKEQIIHKEKQRLRRILTA